MIGLISAILPRTPSSAPDVVAHRLTHILALLGATLLIDATAGLLLGSSRARRVSEWTPAQGIDGFSSRIGRIPRIVTKDFRPSGLTCGRFGKSSCSAGPGPLAERNADGKPRRLAAKRNLGHLPGHLPRIEQVIEPARKICPCGCTDMVKIGSNGWTSFPPVPHLSRPCLCRSQALLHPLPVSRRWRDKSCRVPDDLLQPGDMVFSLLPVGFERPPSNRATVRHASSLTERSEFWPRRSRCLSDVAR